MTSLEVPSGTLLEFEFFAEGLSPSLLLGQPGFVVMILNTPSDATVARGEERFALQTLSVPRGSSAEQQTRGGGGLFLTVSEGPPGSSSSLALKYSIGGPRESETFTILSTTTHTTEEMWEKEGFLLLHAPTRRRFGMIRTRLLSVPVIDFSKVFQDDVVTVRQMCRGHRELGCCYVTNHCCYTDSLSRLRSALGVLPHEDLIEGAAVFHKLDYGVVTETVEGVRVMEMELPEHARGMEDVGAYLATFEERAALANVYLKALAQGAPWGDATYLPRRKIRMSCLQYFPGDPGVHTTVRHTDTSWLTVLQQEETGGLVVHRLQSSEETVDVPPRSGMLLVKSGMGLEEASEGVYKGVQHAVIRPEGPEALRTRFSLPFFWGKA